MLKDMLVGTFKDGEYFLGLTFWGLFLLVCLLILGGVAYIYDEISWFRISPVPHTARLLSLAHVESTRQTQAFPVFTGGGAGVGVVTTGHGQEYLTTWEMDGLGRHVVDDEEIFRWAKPISTLMIKVRGDEIRIVGIVRD